MIPTGSEKQAAEWLLRFLEAGGILSQRLVHRLRGPVRYRAIVPNDWQARSADDFDLGGRHLDRSYAVRPIRALLTDHFNSQLACAFVEDRWAARPEPCGEGSLPWISVKGDRKEETYWVCDARWAGPRADAILGAATGRRFLAVLSAWGTRVPELCRSVPERVLDEVSSHARTIITEIFDGESYLVAEIPAGS